LTPERVVVAEILRARGNRGEVLAQSQTDVLGRLESLRRAQVQLADGTDIPVEIEQAWQHGDHWVFKFAGSDSIEAAERFRGADLWIPREERGQLPDGEFFRSDLLGCAVRDLRTNEVVGTVKAFEQYGGPLLLVVESGRREVLIPFVPDICRSVDVAAKTISAEFPDGLLAL
jgi:16S rRNA processing protein RimM